MYVPIFPPAVPPELADSSQWERFARLRDKVEADPDAFDDARAVLAPVEAELWAAAADAYVRSEQRRRETFAAQAFAPVDGALRRLGV